MYRGDTDLHLHGIRVMWVMKFSTEEISAYLWCVCLERAVKNSSYVVHITLL